MRRPIRWLLVVPLCVALAAPTWPAAGTRAFAGTSMAAAPNDAGPGVNTRGGVGLAMGCGFSLGLFGVTGQPLMLVLAIASCSFMILDALATPDQ